MILHQGLACGRRFCDMMWSYASMNVRQSLPAYVLGQFDFATLLHYTNRLGTHPGWVQSLGGCR